MGGRDEGKKNDLNRTVQPLQPHQMRVLLLSTSPADVIHQKNNTSMYRVYNELSYHNFSLTDWLITVEGNHIIYYVSQ